MLKSKEVEIKNIKIEYFFGGRGLPLVFIHGLGLNPRNYMRALELLSKHFTVYAPSVPGHGKSDLPEDTSLENVSEVLYGFIKKLKLKDITLVGTSMGGLLSIYIASNHPKSIKRLVTVNSAGIAIKMSLFEGLILLIYDTLREINSAKKLKQLLFDTVTWSKSFVVHVFNLKAWAFVRELVHTTHENKIKKVKTPTTILWAKGDLVLPISYAKKMRELIKNSKLVFIENHCHHWVGLNQELFYKTLMRNI